MSYRIDVPGLDETVARTTPTPKHERLVACLRKFDALSNAKLRTQRRDAYLGLQLDRKLSAPLPAKGALCWFKEATRVARAGGDPDHFSEVASAYKGDQFAGISGCRAPRLRSTVRDEFGNGA